ncbi:MAG: hypothetical protein AMS15_00685 [Planctomycetes bacterium DG_23]|nr:MAG: hypothetical protein AMS15_00685 [Planctomycetes bacterium DG_23]
MNVLKKYLVRMCAIVAIYFVLGFGAHLVDEVLDMPHPYCGPHTSWFRLALYRGVHLGIIFAAAIFFIANLSVVVDWVRATGPRPLREDLDMDYYPRFWQASRWLRSRLSRLVLIAGFLVIVGYWTATIIWIWEAEQSPHGMISPPHRISSVICFGWSVAWLADSLQRKSKSTVVGSVLFMMLTSWQLYVVGVYPLVG